MNNPFCAVTQLGFNAGMSLRSLLSLLVESSFAIYTPCLQQWNSPCRFTSISNGSYQWIPEQIIVYAWKRRYAATKLTTFHQNLPPPHFLKPPHSFEPRNSRTNFCHSLQLFLFHLLSPLSLGNTHHPSAKMAGNNNNGTSHLPPLLLPMRQ